MVILTRRTLLRGSLGLAAAGALARPYIANGFKGLASGSHRGSPATIINPPSLPQAPTRAASRNSINGSSATLWSCST